MYYLFSKILDCNFTVDILFSGRDLGHIDNVRLRIQCHVRTRSENHYLLYSFAS